MQFQAESWHKLSELLDQVLDLAPPKREEWLRSLGPEHDELRETLEEILRSDQGAETSDFARALPEFSALPSALRAGVGDRIGPYKLVRELGAGGTSSVWLAERADGGLQRQVALKLPYLGVVDRGLGPRLQQERDILASLEHPNIARLYDAGTDENGRPYLALEYVEGIPPDRFSGERQLSIQQRLELFLRIARAVAFAHNRLIVHRDLKPNNILVTADGEVRLLDFGIAKLLQSSGGMAATRHTQLGQRALTPTYAAPEQFTNEPITVATDVYALGVILFELLTGLLPYRPKRTTPAALEESIVREEPPLASEVAPSREARMLKGDLDTILAKALRKGPLERYASVETFAQDIERYLAGQPIAARPATFAYRAGKFLRRNVAGVIVAGGAVVLVATALAIALGQWREAEAQRAIAADRLLEANAAARFSTAVMTEALRGNEPITPAELLEKSAQLARTVGGNDTRTKIVAANFAANWYVAHGMNREAEELLTKTLAELPTDVGELRVTLECNRAATMFRLGRTDDALAQVSAALARPNVDDALIQSCFGIRAGIARSLNDAPTAVRNALEAMRRGATAGSETPEDRALSLLGVGVAYAITDRPNDGRPYFLRALAELENAALGDAAIAAAVHHGWGATLLASGAPHLALEEIDRGIEILEQRMPGQPMPDQRLRARAQALVLLGRLSEADTVYEELLDRAAASGNAVSEAQALVGQAEVAVAREQWDEAKVHLDAATPAIEASELLMPHSVVLAHQLSLARTKLELGLQADARELASEVTSATSAAKCCASQQAQAWIVLARAAAAGGDMQVALANAERALAIAEAARGEERYSVYVAIAQRARANVLSATGRHDDAAAAQQIATQHLVATRSGAVR